MKPIQCPSWLTLPVVIGISALAAAGVFVLWPEFDLFFSGLFFRPETQDFAGSHNAFVLAIYKNIPVFSKIFIVCAVLAFIGSLFLRGPKARLWRVRTGFLALALAIAPGLIVDVGLKNHIGRARPWQVAEFGGKAQFTPAFFPSDQCKKNCSFVSGHASAGFFFAAFGFLGGIAARRRWTFASIALGAIFGLGRISQGGHFLSDIVFAFYFTWFGIWLVWVIFRRAGFIQKSNL
ncbi:MAG: phosphatase PAP2 family protein [Azoarcus sp.]|nr:phosphatase PAP2 family protein [Azoarcus sp.]